ncbi:Mannan endo-1-6-alpha-mannosidase DCW1, partial [Penicillium citrinum]
MAAAERNFTNPSSETPGYVSMVQAVFDERTHRWDMTACQISLRWQLFGMMDRLQKRHSNGCLFDVAARLARYTGNATYAEWATKAWDWTKSVGLITPDWQVSMEQRTTRTTSTLSSNSSDMTSPSSDLQFVNVEDTARWPLGRCNHFFSKNESSKDVMYEPPCELIGKCNVDQLSFKAYISPNTRILSLAPHTYEECHEWL